MRLIDAEALKQKVKDELPAMSNWGEIFIPNVIDSSPTIDAEPIIHAHWEETGRFEKDGVNYICYRCSISDFIENAGNKQEILRALDVLIAEQKWMRSRNARYKRTEISAVLTA